MPLCKGLFGLSYQCNTCEDREFCFQQSTGNMIDDPVAVCDEDNVHDRLLIALEKIFSHKPKYISLVIMRTEHKRFGLIAKQLNLSRQQIFNITQDIKIMAPAIYHVIKHVSSEKTK